ncbi:MAG: ester cyclase [Bacteriovoracaceae bacterium]|nr:ester cyclase [Bacteriovoracaceae bacterium]
MIKRLIFLLVFISFSVFAENKEIVRNFYETAFVKHQPIHAMKNFVGSKYIQHNPHVSDGPKPFISYFSEFYKKNPHATTKIMRLIAEGELVVVHSHSKANSTDLGYAAIDIFRLENGKIVEHWDTVQPVPEKSANTNTMF